MPDGSTLDTLAAEVRARLDKADSEKRLQKALDFRISAAMCLRDAGLRFKTIGGSAAFWKWIANEVRCSKDMVWDCLALIGIERPRRTPQDDPYATERKWWTDFTTWTRARGKTSMYKREGDRKYVVYERDGGWKVSIFPAQERSAASMFRGDVPGEAHHSPEVYPTAEAARHAAFNARVFLAKYRGK